MQHNRNHKDDDRLVMALILILILVLSFGCSTPKGTHIHEDELPKKNCDLIDRSTGRSICESN